MEQQYDVLIIGGGVLGVTLAYHLGKRRVRTLLVEKEMLPGMHASGKNAGMFRQLYRHPQLTKWALQSRQCWPEELRASCFRETGSLIVGREAPACDVIADPDPLFRSVTHDDYAAVFTETDGLLDSPNYVQQICRLTESRYVETAYRTEVVSLEHLGNHWLASSDTGASIRADYVVNAGGAWTGALSRTPLEVQPYARHLFVVEGWPKNFMPAPGIGYYWDEIGEWYMRAWSETARLVSICDREAATPERFVPAPDIQERLAAKLLAAVPQLAPQLRVGRSWFCFRTYAADQLPVWGYDEEQPSLFWLAAFGGLGMSVSYAATEDAARALCGEAVDVSADFQPQRVKVSRPPRRVHQPGY
ncbi:MAG: FAD-binding oxidoreductase [Bdellovibrionales bacterium]|nr:FAD-binding oxidoreductase [Bdellovibrionales bacterium]